jgi:hypothetical protein
MDDILQLKVTLKWTEPPIWRRIQVEKNITFFVLHHIIQIAMGWEDYHLYEFKIDNYRIGEPNEELDGFGFRSNKLIDASTITLDRIITDTKKRRFEYEYDFGDGWIHQISIEKFLPRDNSKSYPICTDGKLNCPPEDCGGVGGFYQLLDIIEDKNHPEHKDMIEWLGGLYDQEYFDINEINNKLAELDQYIKEWSDNE